MHHDQGRMVVERGQALCRGAAVETLLQSLGAAVFNAFGNSRVYGFQYSDYFSSSLGDPPMPVQPSIPIRILIQGGFSISS